eukprot:6210107-Pleurochrysis_carterae.AAC.1
MQPRTGDLYPSTSRLASAAVEDLHRSVPTPPSLRLMDPSSRDGGSASWDMTPVRLRCPHLLPMQASPAPAARPSVPVSPPHPPT